MNNDVSLDNFKKWMKDQDKTAKLETHRLIGTLVKPIIKRIEFADVADIIEGKSRRIVKEFYKKGGVIFEVHDSDVLIGLDSGKFYIFKRYITIA